MWPAWKHSLEQIRKEGLTADVSRSYELPEFAWMQQCLVCAMVMLFDREFYDSATNAFTVEPYIARLREDYGEVDALVLWQAYPRIGFDSRNQYDHYRLAPGLRSAVDRLHALGVKAFMAYNPWDTGTRRDPLTDPEAIASVVREFDFDGVFLDTLREGDQALRTALDKAKPGVVMESEDALPVPAMAGNHASWAQWFDDSEAPGIMRNRWIERRHMQHLIRRWDLDHVGEMQMAWMNGAGMLVWENIFGSWNGWSERDRAMLRSLLPARRQFSEFFEKGTWEPLPPTHIDGVYATKWTLGSTCLYTVVNRKDQPAKGQVASQTSDGVHRLFDVIAGRELDHAVLEIPPRWIGGILITPSSAVDSSLDAFLNAQMGRYQPSIDPMARTEPLTVRASTPFVIHKPNEAEFVTVNGGKREVVSRMWARECGEYGPARFGGSSYIPLHYERKIQLTLEMGSFAMVRQDVTNREFERFVKSGYKPANADSFLLHWKDGKPLDSNLDKPVVYVCLDDARAYAKWAHMRLPTEVEWQCAVLEHGLPHGVVWNWTESEYFDGHTRFSILKGGCQWKAVGSEWYADSGPRKPDWSTKYIHFFPALDRCETIGFRCAMDLP